MYIKFQIKEPGNLFHVLDSLSQWDIIHTRKSLAKYYKERFSLNKKDKKLIKLYIKIRRKYYWGKLDSDFYLSENFNELEKRLKRRLNEKEFKEIKVILDNFHTKICFIFQEWKPLLEKRKDNLNETIKRYPIKNIFQDIANFYNIKNIPRKVTVHLLLNPSEKTSGGGANIWPKEHITLEPKDLKHGNKNLAKEDISIIIHEILHLIENNMSKKNKRFLNRIFNKERINRYIFREAIADALVPDGHIALKYGLIKHSSILKLKDIKLPRKDNKKEYLRKARNKLSALFYPIVIKQIESKKTIFKKEFLKRYIETYKELF